MAFKLIPILDQMEELYLLPRSRERFAEYLKLLQGNSKDDMLLPIGGYNPMGKESVLLKLRELKSIEAEKIIQEELARINQNEGVPLKEDVELVINLVDDIGGAWSNGYSTDYSSKFEIAALVRRRFCTPIFWTSEAYTREKIIQRTREYIFRTIFWLSGKKPKTLKDLVEQELFVQRNSNKESQLLQNQSFEKLEKFYLDNQQTDNYTLIFNFFYGDEASKSLEYERYGMEKYAGFEYVKRITSQT